MIYFLDTNILITAARDYYRFSFGPGFWSWILKENQEKRLWSIDLVRKEIREENQEFSYWLNFASQQGFFVQTQPEWIGHYQNAIQHVSTRYKDGQYKSDFVNGADPWLLAAAAHYGGTVLTLEQPAPNSTTKPKIPTVADALGIGWSEPWSVYEELQARFSS